ncbi:MAG: MFS transporter [Chloroflexota bacterium]
MSVAGAVRPDGAAAGRSSPSRFAGLRHHPDFLKLWAGQTISLFGSQVTVLALPLAAVLAFGASAAEMGVLTALQFAPALAVGLFAGVWVDRLRRRPVLIVADVGRAALLVTIPAAAFLGLLRIELLYAIAFGKGALDVLSDVARGSFLPSLVRREQLAEANGKLAMSRSVASVAGPGLGGALVQLLTAPVAMAVDAISFIVSALCLGIIRAPEAAPAPPAQGRRMWAEIKEGLGVVLGNPLLRIPAGAAAILNLFAAWVTAIEILYFTRELRLEPAVLGTVLTAGSFTAPVGAALSARAAKRFGLGPTMIGAMLTFCAAHLPVALAAGPPLLVALSLLVAIALVRFITPIYEVNSATLQQAVTPHRLLGRVGASARFVIHGPVPIGALLGGAVGTAIGLRPAFALAVLGQFLAVLWLFLSPVRRLREPPP